jgi:4-alpha-glucanotransferase
MKIMMFAFDGNDKNDYLPKNIEENSVTYTGTHDNDTALGFLLKMNSSEFKALKHNLRKALRSEGVYMPIVTVEDTAQAMVLCALNTKSDLVIIPIQDILGLDNMARMNTPSTVMDNWQFRLKKLPARQKMAQFRKLIIASKRN